MNYQYELYDFMEKEKIIGIIDADLVGRKKHRFPNLACMKISAYYKTLGYDTELITSFDFINKYKKVFISKVFTDTEIPNRLLQLPNVEYGGTGFFFDKAEPLSNHIEFHFPDYELYMSWVNEKLNQGEKKKDFKYYLDYSIGYTTRGCFRQCEFCVLQNESYVRKHSDLHEFVDPSRKKICLLDDNVLGYQMYEEIFKQLHETTKPFKFKQGMDFRLLNQESMELLIRSKYDGQFTFAYDNIEDKSEILNNLKLWNKVCANHNIYYENIKFYVLVGFDKNNKYNQNFWLKDLHDAFERIKDLMEHNAFPYIMRFKEAYNSPYSSFYSTLASWTNQPAIFKKHSFRLFAMKRGLNTKYYNKNKHKQKFNFKYYIKKGYKKGSTWKQLDLIEALDPVLAKKYFNLHFEEIVKIKRRNN